MRPGPILLTGRGSGPMADLLLEDCSAMSHFSEIRTNVHRLKEGRGCTKGQFVGKSRINTRIHLAIFLHKTDLRYLMNFCAKFQASPMHISMGKSHLKLVFIVDYIENRKKSGIHVALWWMTYHLKGIFMLNTKI